MSRSSARLPSPAAPKNAPEHERKRREPQPQRAPAARLEMQPRAGHGGAEGRQRARSKQQRRRGSHSDATQQCSIQPAAPPATIGPLPMRAWHAAAQRHWPARPLALGLLRPLPAPPLPRAAGRSDNNRGGLGSCWTGATCACTGGSRRCRDRGRASPGPPYHGHEETGRAASGRAASAPAHRERGARAAMRCLRGSRSRRGAQPLAELPPQRRPARRTSPPRGT